MTLEPNRLIGGYLDETLSPEEHAAFAHWLKQAPENARQFARAVLLHDRLRSELLTPAQMMPEARPALPVLAVGRPHRRLRRVAVIAGVAASLVVLLAVLWNGLGDTPASAASVELNRIIAANAKPTDRTYQIVVEQVAPPQPRGERPEPPVPGRPPKPPMDGAMLHVRRGGQFVLVRTTRDGLPFVTGSNGQTSWAVRPDGPVRVSSDLARFNRDVPGHEHAMPLIYMKELLERLRAAYDVRLLPVERSDESIAPNEKPLRLLVAVKRRGDRGPGRVEITYAARTGRLRRLRFVDMPYGPDRLTLRLTLVDERNLDATFFDHESHHAPDRAIEFE